MRRILFPLICLAIIFYGSQAQAGFVRSSDERASGHSMGGAIDNPNVATNFDGFSFRLGFVIHSFGVRQPVGACADAASALGSNGVSPSHATPAMLSAFAVVTASEITSYIDLVSTSLPPP